jgi:hypothetical protein
MEIFIARLLPCIEFLRFNNGSESKIRSSYFKKPNLHNNIKLLWQQKNISKKSSHINFERRKYIQNLQETPWAQAIRKIFPMRSLASGQSEYDVKKSVSSG